LRAYDGLDEGAQVTVPRQVLKTSTPVEVPTEPAPTRRAAARERFAWLADPATVRT